MKFLEIAELDVLSRALNLSTPTLKVTTRVEAYSCKAISRERKLFKTLETELLQDMAHSTSISPPENHSSLLDSAFGPLDKRESRKTLWLLIGLLNVAFPDHDFSKVRPEEFRREEGARTVLASLSAALDHLKAPSQRSFSSYPPSSSIAFPTSPASYPSTTPTSDSDLPTNPFLRQVLDPVIDLAECEVFTYTPDMDSDPYSNDSDDESSEDGDGDAYEREEEGIWEMEGVDNAAGSSASYGYGPSWSGGYGTPQKGFSSFGIAPGTPTSFADPDEWNEGSRRKGGNSLLFSSHYFLFNKKMKRILFISTSAHGRSGAGYAAYIGAGGMGMGVNTGSGSNLKRRKSDGSVRSLRIGKRGKTVVA
ncbi:mitogen-activated protein kinase Maf1 [Pseudohyphozyma bogoriensis]|nr:mitogen-activated protein kinase Maf1 [Pseudohyphozyma bogoriensis]